MRTENAPCSCHAWRSSDSPTRTALGGRSRPTSFQEQDTQLTVAAQGAEDVGKDARSFINADFQLPSISMRLGVLG